MNTFITSLSNFLLKFRKPFARISKTVETRSSGSAKGKNRDAQSYNVMSEVISYLDKHYEFRYNVIREQTEFRSLDEENSLFRPVTQRELNSICIDMKHEGVRCWDRDLARYVSSSKIEEYHPFRLYMDELPQWDGKNRVSDLARRVSDDEQWVNDFHRWMLGMAAQWQGMTGNHGNSVAPVLVSREQGRLKSTFCKALLPSALSSYYTDSFELTSQSRAEQKMAEMGLINMDEFDKFSAKRMPQLKNIMQTATLNMRKAYQKNFHELPRIASFIATSNRMDLLTDQSGSRRFICVEVKEKIDCEGIEHKQLYAQLKAELAAGERYWFSGEEEEKLQERNQKFIRTSAAIDLFQSLFRPAQKGEQQSYSLSEILDIMKRKNRLITKNLDPLQLARDILATGIERRHTHQGNRYSVALIKRAA